MPSDGSLTHLYFVHSFILLLRLIYQVSFFLMKFLHTVKFSWHSPTSLFFSPHWSHFPVIFFFILYSHYNGQKKRIYVQQGMPQLTTSVNMINFNDILCLRCPLSKRWLFVVTLEKQIILANPYSGVHLQGQLWVCYKLP